MANPIKDTNPESQNTYGFAASDETFFTDPNPADIRGARGMPGYNDTVDRFRSSYSIPYNEVLNHVLTAENLVFTTMSKVEDNLLRKIYIEPYCDLDLQKCHAAVWAEASTKMDIPDKLSDVITIPENTNEIVAKDNTPSYICFDEYLYAERSSTTASRRFLSEYADVIAHSTFSYLFQIRKVLKYILNELTCIKKSLLTDIGGSYDNESQQKIAAQYEGWAKKAIHYSQRVSKTTGSKAEQIPQSEMDSLSKSQAAKLQAFFAIRLSAVDSELEDLLSSLKRDLMDNCDIFYERFLSPAIRITKDISAPLLLDLQTTSFRSSSPTLAQEIDFASNVINANFVSVQTDYFERHEAFSVKLDALFNLIIEKKKYSNYISQLANMATSKKKILKNVEEDVYSSLFKKVYIDNSPVMNLTSEHSLLDGLDKNDHPQYLLRSGGHIEGSVTVDDGVTIDGVDVSAHSHTGYDGTSRIKAFDIDYDSVRVENREEYVKSPVSLSVEKFIETIADGGIPRFDAVILIDVEDDTLENHEYELLYSEID